jgi:ABC-type phosphate/phosphonate transport system permease subunit
MYGVLADLVVLVHILYVGYVLVGQLAIIVAAAFRWEWGRNRWFRLTHLLAIAVVALEAVMGWQCPFTKWEYQLRELAGQSFDGSATFMGRLLHNLLFIDQYFEGGRPPEASFTTLYIAMLIIVVQGLVMYPPRLFPRRESVAAPAPQPA